MESYVRTQGPQQRSQFGRGSALIRQAPPGTSFGGPPSSSLPPHRGAADLGGTQQSKPAQTEPVRTCTVRAEAQSGVQVQLNQRESYGHGRYPECRGEAALRMSVEAGFTMIPDANRTAGRVFCERLRLR